MSFNVIAFPFSTTISYEEIDRTEEYQSNGFSAVRKYKCAWGDRLILSKDLLGRVVNSGTTFNYFLPQQHPDYPSCVALRVTIAPFSRKTTDSGTTTNIAYEEAELTVNFGIPTMDIREDEPERVLVTEELQPSSEFITAPNRKLYWDTEQEEELETDEAPGLLVRMVEWIYTIHFLADLPTNLLDYIGCVNSVDVYSPTLGLTFDAGTLLVNEPSLRRQITTDEVKSWEVTYRFSHRPQGWNNLPKAGQGLNFQPVYDETGARVYFYDEADIRDLLIVGVI